MKVHWPDVVGYQNSQGSNGFAISKGKGTMCPQFADNIVEDICQLNDCNFWEEVCCHSIVLLESAEVTYLCL